MPPFLPILVGALIGLAIVDTAVLPGVLHEPLNHTAPVELLSDALAPLLVPHAQGHLLPPAAQAASAAVATAPSVDSLASTSEIATSPLITTSPPDSMMRTARGPSAQPAPSVHTSAPEPTGALLSLVASLTQKISALVSVVSAQQEAQKTIRVPEHIAASGNGGPASGGYILAGAVGNTPASITSLAASAITGTITNAIDSVLATIDDLTATEFVAVNATSSTLYVSGTASLATTSIASLIVSSTTTSAGLRISALDCSSYGNGGTLTTDVSGNVICATDDGGGLAAGSDAQIQFNSGSAFAASPAFTFDAASARLGVTNASTTNLSSTYASSTLAAFGNLSLSHPLTIQNGGTGLSAVASSSVIVGGADNSLIQMSTSTLGLPTFADLTAYYTLASWYSTTTSDLEEGSNLYFTAERVDDRVSTLLQAGSGVDLSYDDTSNTLTISSFGGGGSGTDVNWAYPSFGFIRPATSSNIVLVGQTSTTSHARLQVTGGATIDAATTSSLVILGLANTLLYANGSGAIISVATSSLGLPTFADLSSSLGNYLSLPSWYATSTSDIEEGTNLYFTTGRATTSFVGNLAATSSVSAILTLPNLSITTAQVANLTDSLDSFVSASSTVPKVYTANVFSALQAFTNSSTTLASFSYASTTNLFAGLAAFSGLSISGSATSTSNVGFNLTGGCFAIAGSCIGGGTWSSLGYPFPSAATTTLLAFNGGFTTTNATGTTLFAQGLSANTARFGQSATSSFASNGALTLGGTLTLSGALNGPLQANGSIVSATTSIGVLYGGTGLTTAPSYGQLLTGNSSGGYTLTATSSLGLLSATQKDWNILFGALTPTTTLGILVTASSTIGNGTQAGGLTISGGATTTGNAYFAGTVGAGTTSLSATFNVDGSVAVGGNKLIDFNGHAPRSFADLQVAAATPSSADLDTVNYDFGPVIVAHPDNTLFMFTMAGDTHPGINAHSVIWMRSSTDGGVTWSATSTVQNELSNGYDSRGPAAGIAQNGRLVLAYALYNTTSGAAVGFRVKYSDDKGLTWSTPTAVTGFPYGRIVNIGAGRLLLSTYSGNAAHVYTSDNNGRTWIQQSDALPSDATYQPTETAYAHLGGSTVLAIGRLNAGTAFRQAISDDNGQTWTLQGTTTFDTWTTAGPGDLETYEGISGKMVRLYYQNRTDDVLRTIEAPARALINDGTSGWDTDSLETVATDLIGLSGYATAIHQRNTPQALIAYTIENSSTDADTVLLSHPSSQRIVGNTNFLGSLGFGTTSPKARVHIMTTSTSSNTIDTAALLIQNSSTVLDYERWGLRLGTNGSLNFDTSSGGLDSTRWTMTRSGLIGIATTTPWRTLSVTGTVGFSSTLSTESGSDNYLCIDPTTYEITNGGANCAASSQRYKENIQDLSYGLDDILVMRPVSFQWTLAERPNDRSTQVGFIAEEMNGVVPEVVEYTASGTPESIDYDKLTAVLARAIQEIARITGAFRTNLIAWFADATNGITKIVTGLLSAHRIETDELCARKSDGTFACFTGDQLAAVIASPAVAPAPPAPASSAPAEDTTPPVITIQGNNPAEIMVGTAYADLGAIISDDTDTNPTLSAFLDGSLVDAITIDTSAPATHSIDYVARDDAGNTATSTRTVIVSLPASEPAPPSM